MGAMPSLRSIDAGGNRLTNIDAIAGATNIESLYLWNNRIATLPSADILVTLTELSTLRVDSNRLTDVGIASVSVLGNLERFGADWNELLTDVSPLGGLLRLEWLSLAGTDITSLEFARSLTSLESLFVHYTEVTDLTPLLDITLSLSDVWIGSLDLSCDTTGQATVIDLLQADNVTVHDIPSGCD